MGLMNVVETSVFTRMHRQSIRERILTIAAEDLARSSVTDLEIGHSARNAAEWDENAEMLGAFTELQLSHDVVDRARQVQRLLAERGLRGRKVPDLLIAATAELADASVLHYDKDFEIIASVTGQQHDWVVPAGSVD